MEDAKIPVKSIQEEIDEVEQQILDVKAQLAALKQRRRTLYAQQGDRQREALAKAASELGMDYDSFISQINRFN